MGENRAIERLVEDGVVDEVVQLVKTGKEAEVYVVRRGTSYLAAKVYKDRTRRAFHNNAGYREGREVRNTRDRRAMQTGTAYGRDLSEAEWLTAEHDALVALSQAGVRVPRPDLYYEGVLVMELLLAADGRPAPRLADVTPTRDEALRYHREIISMMVRMLCCDLVHGDLSPYNVLLAWDGPTIIDLPQVVKAAHNSQAEQFVLRDARNVTAHLARFAPELHRRVDDGRQIWRAYVRRELTPDFFPSEVPLVPRERRDGGRRPERRGPPPHAVRQHADGQGRAPPAQHRPAHPREPHPRSGAPANAHPQPSPAASPRPQNPIPPRRPGPGASRFSGHHRRRGG